MSVNNHTDISSGAAANAATVNSPLGQLDAAIGNLTTLTTTAKTSAVAAINEIDAQIGTAASVSGTIGTSIDTDGTLKAGAVDATAVIADAVVSPAKITEALQALANRSNCSYGTPGSFTWYKTTRTISFDDALYVFWHTGAGLTYLTIPQALSPITLPAADNNWYAVYVSGVSIETTQTANAGGVSNITVESVAAISVDLMRSDVVVLALIRNSAVAPSINSPFLDNQMQRDFLSQKMFIPNGQYFTPTMPTWSETAKTLTYAGPLYVFFGEKNQFTYLEVTSAASPIDFSAIPAGYYGIAYVTGITPGTVNTKTAVTVERIDQLSVNILSPGTVVVAVVKIASSGAHHVWCPFVQNLFVSDLLHGKYTAPDPWVNLYPHITSQLSTFAKKLMNPTSDVKIVLWGDSILASDLFTSAQASPTDAPPGMHNQMLSWYLWRELPQPLRAIYRRYDYTSYFTFTGSWSATATDAAWDDSGRTANITNFSASADAAFAWTLPAEANHRYTGCNLVYRSDVGGDAAATITVTEGNGYLEYWTGAAWAEANGATFSMQETDDGAGYANTVFGKRLKLRKATAHHADAMTITIGKASADIDRLLMWGVELYNAEDGCFITQVYNAGRGGNSFGVPGGGTYALTDFMEDTVIGFDPDLVIVEIPLINMVASLTTLTNIRNSVQDSIWGDRGGATNTYALKKRLPSANILLVIPHHDYAHYNADNTFAAWGSAGLTYKAAYNVVKELFLTQADIPFVDMSAAWKQAIDKDYLFNSDYRAALYSGAAASNQYTFDGTHQTDKGTVLYARHLCPILDISTI